jgi:C2H2-type zinc finger/Zinc finger, C2H2 type
VPYVEYDEVEAACSDCGRLFRSEEALEAHRLEAHGGDPRPRAPPSRQVRCAVCHREFPSVSALARHNRSAHTA